MDVDKVIEYWLNTADDDLKSIHICFRGRDYVKALYWGHLYLEKLLKAVITKQTGRHAPYGHALDVLATKASLSLQPQQIELLDRVTRYNIQARYPDYKFKLKKQATRDFCQKEIKEIEDFGKWLKSMLKS
ncbi:MAG TPA: HEPN domain-containing protein [Anaerolineae bacterium]|nr:HEPN domain-containing protein [Anaerolineae bacterium]